MVAMLARQVAAGLAERRGGARLEPDARRAGEVGRGVAGDRRRGGVHHEHAGAAVGQGGGDDEVVGGRTAHDGVGHAVERPAAVGHRGAYAVRARGPATAGRGVGRGQHDLAGAEPAQQVGLLLGGPHGGDEAAGVHDRREVGLGGEHAAELLAHDPDLDGPGTDAAVGLAERQPEDAHLGQPAPQGAVEPRVVGHRAAPRLVVGVRRREQAADRLAQGLLLVVVGEVHVVVPSESQDRAADDLALDLVGPAVDRGLAQVEVGRRGPPGPALLRRVVTGARRRARPARRGRARARSRPAGARCRAA